MDLQINAETRADELAREVLKLQAENERLRKELKNEKAITKNMGVQIDFLCNWQKTQTDAGKRIEELTKALEEIASKTVKGTMLDYELLFEIRNTAEKALKGGE
jgi:hypothetical protein